MADPVDSAQPNNPEGADRPDWMPDNFNDPHDFRKSYDHAQAAKTQAEQRAAELERELAATQAKVEEFAAQQQYQAQQTQTQDIFAQIEMAREMGDIKAEMTLQAQLVAQAMQPALQQFVQQMPQAGLDPKTVTLLAETALVKEHADWGDYQAQAVEFLNQNDWLVPDDVNSNPASLARVLDVAYRAVKGEALAANPQLAPPDLSAAKQNAQTMSGAGQRQATPSDNEEWARAIREADIGGFRL